MLVLKPKNILISSVGSPAGRGVVDCLKDVSYFRLVGLDANQNCPGKEKLNRFYPVPKNNDPRYLTEIRDIMNSESCDLFIPTIQPDLFLVSELSKITKVLSAKPDVLKKCLNKKEIYKRMLNEGFSDFVPKHFSFMSSNKLENSSLRKLGYPEQPICIKPVTEHGGLAIKKINVATPDIVADYLFNNKDPNWRTIEELKKMLNYCEPIELLASEYLPGDEYSVDTLVVDGEVKIAVPRKRIRVSGGIVIQGVVEKNEQLIAAVKRILPIFDLEYFVNVQFRYSGNGMPKLIDINPRFCGSHIMSFGAGVNFPLLSIKSAFKEPIDIVEPKWGVGMIRYWEKTFYES